MNKQQALAILKEAEQDRRLTAHLDTRYVQAGSQRGYHVRVTLRNDRELRCCNLDDWRSIQSAWQGL